MYFCKNYNMENIFGNRPIEEKLQAEQEIRPMEFILFKERQEVPRRTLGAEGMIDTIKNILERLTRQIFQYESIQSHRALSIPLHSKLIIGNGQQSVVLNP